MPTSMDRNLEPHARTLPKIRSYDVGVAEQLSRGQLHNELVGGSNPSSPTMSVCCLGRSEATTRT